MPKKPKENDAETVKKPKSDKPDSWAEDQEERGYYYDDAHGYEPYEPDNDDDIDDKKKGEPGPP